MLFFANHGCLIISYSSQALVGRAIAHHGSISHSEHLSLPSFNLSTLSSQSIKSSTSQITRAIRSRKRVVSRSSVRATIVETFNMIETTLVDKSVNIIRFLAIDDVEKDNSGHPGLAMGCAPIGDVLYDKIMRYNPKNLYWFNRDRFVLFVGHGCLLQYALLDLAGYDSVLEDDLKQFRQLGSRTWSS